MTTKHMLSNHMEFMRVPAGKFIMGTDNSKYDHDRPQHTIDIPYDYWMARCPVTNLNYNAYVNAKRIDHPVYKWQQMEYRPVVCVNWIDAMEYCRWLNKIYRSELPSTLILRLPTEAEWEKAARGTDGREYPWGNEFNRELCNAEADGLKEARGDIKIIKSYSPRGDSPYGCADMAGNVSEWTHSMFKSYPYNGDDGRESESESDERVVRNGSWWSSRDEVRCASRGSINPKFAYDFIGFRVCVSYNLA